MIDNKIKEIVQNKDVALVGNASSIFKEKRPIDNHEVVIRMNQGFPKMWGMLKGYIGERTDILALSLALEEEIIKKQFNPKAILWCTPKWELMNDYLRKNAIRFSLQDWQLIVDVLHARPSTGFMTFFYVLSSCKKITLYGFDFWETSNFYTNNIHIGPHNPKREKKIIESLIEGKGEIVK